MVCALSVYAPLCISASTFSMFASAIASGRKPSKVTINTRTIGGAGVNVVVGMGVSVSDGGVVLGVKVAIGGESFIGAEDEALVPHDCRNSMKRVKTQKCRIMFEMMPYFLFARFAVMSFYYELAKSFIDRNAIPICLKRQAQRVRYCCGGIHRFDG